MIKRPNIKKLFSICMVLVIMFTFTVFTASSYAVTVIYVVRTPNTTSTTVKSDALVKEVIKLCNNERAKRNFAPLVEDDLLNKLALLKSQDMVAKSYFAHESPTYGYAKDMMRMYNVKYSWLGENIGRANDYNTPQQLVNKWMDSSTHRDNILNPNFTKIGVAYVGDKNGKVYWTQLFLKP